MDDRELDAVPNNLDRRVFLRRMVAAGFALPVVATLESVLAADALAKQRQGHGHGHDDGHGHGHDDDECHTTTHAPATTVAPTSPLPTTQAPQ